MQLKHSIVLASILLGAAHAQAATGPAEFQMCEQAKNPKNYVNDWVTAPLLAIDGKYLFAYDPAKASYITPQDKNTLAELKRLTTALKSKGIQLIAVIPPNRGMAFSVDRKNAVAGQNIKSYADFLNGFSSAGIQNVNILNELASKRTTFDKFYLKRDVHWTQDGSEYVAKLVADLIKKQPAYAALPKTTFTLTRGKAVPFDDAFAADIGKACGKPLPVENTHATELKTSGDVGLLDETPAAPVAIVGTSFTGSTKLNFGEFFSYYAKLPAENYSVDGGLNYDSFLKYLASESYKQHKPKFIIWESLVDYPRDEPASFRQLLAGVYGRCKTPVQQGKLQSGAVAVNKPTNGDKNYLYLDFGTPTVKNYTVNLQYAGSKESIKISQLERIDTRGQYFLELKAGAGALKNFSVVGVPNMAQKANYAVCQKS